MAGKDRKNDYICRVIEGRCETASIDKNFQKNRRRALRKDRRFLVSERGGEINSLRPRLESLCCGCMPCNRRIPGARLRRLQLGSLRRCCPSCMLSCHGSLRRRRNFFFLWDISGCNQRDWRRRSVRFFCLL